MGSALLDIPWLWGTDIFVLTGCLSADTFTPAGCETVRGWGGEDWDGGETCKVPLLLGFFVRGSTNMEMLDVVSLVLWETKVFVFSFGGSLELEGIRMG